jgi:hypothetical protein
MSENKIIEEYPKTSKHSQYSLSKKVFLVLILPLLISIAITWISSGNKYILLYFLFVLLPLMTLGVIMVQEKTSLFVVWSLSLLILPIAIMENLPTIQTEGGFLYLGMYYNLVPSIIIFVIIFSIVKKKF